MYLNVLLFLLQFSYTLSNICTPNALNKVWDDGSNVRSVTSCYGGHWAIAVADQVKSDAKRKDVLFDSILSGQQLISCVHNNWGCFLSSPGSLLYSFNYLKSSRGLQSNSDYKWKGKWKKCRAEPNGKHLERDQVMVENIYQYLANNEPCMADHVLSSGPLAVCLTVGSQITVDENTILSATSCSAPFYIFGVPIYTKKTVCGQIIGINLDGENKFWTFRSSAGSQWNNVMIEYGSNACSISQNPIFTDVLLKESGEF
jgi:hypothetical protein